MSVPWSPSSIGAMTARYPEALKELVDGLEVMAGRRASPRDDPAHVFDFDTGLRLIVSRDRIPGGAIGVHLTVSWREGFIGKPASIEEVHTLTVDAWRSIHGGLHPPAAMPGLLGVSEGGVPHFWLEQRTSGFDAPAAADDAASSSRE